MELVKNIFFNTDKIIKNSKLKISYVGALYTNGSEEVYLHYGFNPTWENGNDIKMEKTELGFQSEIEIGNYDTLGFCFYNEIGQWDNNDGNDYSFDIEEIEEIPEDITENIVAEDSTSDLSLTVTKNNEMELHKGLRKTYIWSKKVKLAIYKIIKFFPKIISGNYKRKVKEN